MSANREASVVICAFTDLRWDDTIAAVRSVQESEPRPLEIVLVIDHNPNLFKRFSRHFIDDTDVIVIENQGLQGLSGARNTGISAARGKYIGFLDDDAVAERDWLSRLTAWCQQPDIIGAGGRVVPLWTGNHPAWFPSEFHWVFGCTYTGMPHSATAVRNPFGGSMVVRREIFEAVGGFRTGTGRVGDVPLGCEETELCIRARQDQTHMQFIFDPEAVILHRVPESRTTWSYFKAHCYNEGLSKALLAKLVGASDSLSSERQYTFKTLPRGVVRGIGDALFHFDLSGLGRAAAIGAGLLITTAGYLVGTMKTTRHEAHQKAVAGDIRPLRSQ